MKKIKSFMTYLNVVVTFIMFIISCVLLYMQGLVSDMPDIYYNFFEHQSLLLWLLLALTFVSFIFSPFWSNRKGK